jgi:hypothetical protein
MMLFGHDIVNWPSRRTVSTSGSFFTDGLFAGAAAQVIETDCGRGRYVAANMPIGDPMRSLPHNACSRPIRRGFSVIGGGLSTLRGRFVSECQRILL